MENFIHLPEVDSTNEYLRRNLSVLPDKTVVWADRQTAGKGTYSRSFLSPIGGVYMSFLFHNVHESLLPYVTPFAAVSVKRALESCFSVSPTIKWVNDLLLDGKKICGILCERSDSSLIVGIGVDLSPPDGGFPPELASIAGTVCSSYPAFSERENFVKNVFSQFVSSLSPDRIPPVMEEYSSSSAVLGKSVCVTRGEEKKVGFAHSITADGALVLLTTEGETIIRSGTLSFL